MNNDIKKLYVSDDNSMVWGILAGIAEYYDTDPTILRLGYVILVLITGIFPGIIAYIIAYFIIPDRPTTEAKMTEKVAPAPDARTVVTEDTKENIGELKKPQWPTITSEPKIEYPETDAPTLDSLMDDNSVGLDDLIDE